MKEQTIHRHPAHGVVCVVIFAVGELIFELVSLIWTEAELALRRSRTGVEYKESLRQIL